jgi:hypothetical protein
MDASSPFADRRVINSEPPIPIGTGPFHIKGAGFLGHMAWVDSSFPGGRQAFLAALTPSMRAYFENVFLALSWYDLLTLASAGHVCAKTLGLPFREFIAMRGRHQAKLDTEGMYKVLLRLASPRLIAPRIPKVMSQYLDFGEVKIKKEEAYGLAFDVTGVPVILSDWMLGVYEGFLDVVIPAAGGTAPILYADVAPQGSAHGFALGTLKVEIRWS